jgi:hypothetical protein
MSIVAMKRKSRLSNVPVSRNGFSLNGGHRNQGWVGQTSLGRANAKTPFKGAFPTGNGGCCGQYKEIVVSSGNCCTNDPSIIKRSTKNTSGLILSRIENPTSVFNPRCDGKCGPEWNDYKKVNWVKSFDPLNHSQGLYIKNVKVASTCNDDPRTTSSNEESCGNTYLIGTRKFTRSTFFKNVNSGVTSAGEYIDTRLLRNNNLPTPPCKKHFPVALNKNGCVNDALTPAEAINLGYLPKDWMNCILPAQCNK